MISIARRLNEMGILGMNRRNARYILQYNQRRLYPLVDDKLHTKRLAGDAGIAIPELYGVVEIQHQVQELPSLVGEHTDFVIKPAKGSGGNGVLVITGRRRNCWLRSDGMLLDEEAIEHHVSNTLSGLYSLGGVPDSALIEYRVKIDPLFNAISYGGVPDIRIVVFRGIPTMAMLRLPTRMSGGKANLHQGGVGVGIDLPTGMTHRGVQQEVPITEHPDTGNPLQDVELPNWDVMLSLASRCYELTGLGYFGADIVLDRNLGPLLLELNARPGLSIQIANRSGLRKRLERVEALKEIPADPEERAGLAVTLFPT